MRKGDAVALLAMDISLLPSPEREYVFFPGRRWRFDFAWPEQKVAVEVDGGTWSGGRHTSGSGYDKDAEKLAEAAILGWTVVRFSSGMVRDGRAFSYIERLLKAVQRRGVPTETQVEGMVLGSLRATPSLRISGGRPAPRIRKPATG